MELKGISAVMIELDIETLLILYGVESDRWRCSSGRETLGLILYGVESTGGISFRPTHISLLILYGVESYLRRRTS